jgi:branched-chain amino acid transport system permease protein
VGVVPFTLMWDAIAAQFPNQTALLLGVSFLLIVYLVPNGVAGLIEEHLGARRRKSDRVLFSIRIGDWVAQWPTQRR